MVLAAGLGTRLRPVTDTLPKPLVEVGGRTLLDHVIDRLARGRGRARRRQPALQGGDDRRATSPARTDPRSSSRPRTSCSTPAAASPHALPLLGESFFVVNGDVFWLDGKVRALPRLAARLRSGERMDALLLLQRTVDGVGYEGRGDFFLDPLGRAAPPRRARGRAVSLRRRPAPAPPPVRRRDRRRVLAEPAVGPRRGRRPARRDRA